MWVRFTADFRWKPTAMSAKVWPAGYVDNVPKEVGEAAIAAGKAEETEALRHGKRTPHGKPVGGKNDEPAAKDSE